MNIEKKILTILRDKDASIHEIADEMVVRRERVLEVMNYTCRQWAS